MEHKLKDAENDVKMFLKLVNGMKRPLLSDLSYVKSVSREAREYYVGDETSKEVNAIGFIINSSISKVIGNFYLDINKPYFQIRLFTFKERAIEWLKTFLSDMNEK